MIAQNRDMQIDEGTVLEADIMRRQPDIRLKKKEWDVVLQIDGSRSVGEIISRIGLEKDEILAVLAKLYQKNLIKVRIYADKVNVDTDFFAKLEHILTEYIGPVAPFVIDEMLVELNEDRSGFNGEKLPLLAEMISRTIDDAVKRIKYQTVILDYLKKT